MLIYRTMCDFSLFFAFHLVSFFHRYLFARFSVKVFRLDWLTMLRAITFTRTRVLCAANFIFIGGRARFRRACYPPSGVRLPPLTFSKTGGEFCFVLKSLAKGLGAGAADKRICCAEKTCHVWSRKHPAKNTLAAFRIYEISSCAGFHKLTFFSLVNGRLRGINCHINGIISFLV